MVKLCGNLLHTQPCEDLWVVLRSSQDIVVVDVQERDRPGLVGTVYVRRNVVTVDQLVVEPGRMLQPVTGVVGQFGGTQSEIRALYVAFRKEKVAVFG